ncbi:hypothetical protein Trco_007783 [Trichoderma cornu-damae]|uniref:Beta-lactamase-related domain-containing protein n=1 Tax=Trichoderma cornu-damae TaxID=654480 RepID=A0A9P8QKP7_9HYPO|nr:hypothetical protein Trco_007783 [Trichoderma cornu-damae]
MAKDDGAKYLLGHLKNASMGDYIREDDAEDAEAISDELEELPIAIAHMASYARQSQYPLSRLLGELKRRDEMSVVWSSDLGMSTTRQYGKQLHGAWDLPLSTLSGEARSLLDIMAMVGVEMPEEMLIVAQQKIFERAVQMVSRCLLIRHSPTTAITYVANSQFANLLRRACARGGLAWSHNIETEVIPQHRSPSASQSLSIVVLQRIKTTQYRPPVITKSKINVAKDVKSQMPQIREICDTSGIVGLSVTVIHLGDIILHENIGYSDLRKKTPVTQDTVFPIGALSQGFTAACVAQLATEKARFEYGSKVPWLPSLESKDPVVAADATIGDLLGHRTGLQGAEHRFLGSRRDNMWYTPVEMSSLQHLEPQASLRSQFIHNPLGYGLLGKLVSQEANQDYSLLLKLRVLYPLGMARTSVISDSPAQVITSSELYGVLDNGRPYHFPAPYDYDREVDDLDFWAPDRSDTALPQGAISGIHSTAGDLAKYCTALNKPWKAQHAITFDGYERVFPNVELLFNPLQPMEKVSPGGKAGKSYAAGWATCSLPARVGDLGINPELVEMPILGAGIRAPLLIQTILDSPSPQDYTRLAYQSEAAARDKHKDLADKIERGRQTGGPDVPLSHYRGLYEAEDSTSICVYVPKRSFVDKLRHKDNLMIRFGHDCDQSYRLRHHHGNTFTWFMPWNERIKHGRALTYHPEFYYITFSPGVSGSMSSLTWANDPAMPKAACYRRKI